MKLSVGARLRSIVCDTQVIVVRAPADEVDVSCGGYPMVALDDPVVAPSGRPKPDMATGAQLGKRYGGEELGIELLVTNAGDGTLAVDGAALPLRAPKVLPSSD